MSFNDTDTDFFDADAGTCDVPLEFPSVFLGGNWKNTRQIEWWHNNAARYGNSNDLQLLIEGDKEDSQEYLRGLLAPSITIFAVAVVWCLLLFLFKCCGSRRVGFLSGGLAPIPPQPVSNGDVNSPEFQQSVQAWERGRNRAERTRGCLRLGIVAAGILIIVSAILLSLQGVDSLIGSLDSVDGTIKTAENLMAGGISLIDIILQNQTEFEAQSERTLEAVNGICPEVRDVICTDVQNVSTCVLDDIFEEGEVADAIIDFFEAVGDSKEDVFDDLVDTRADLVDLLEVANNMNDLSDTFNWAFWCSMGFSLAVAVMCLFLICGAIFPLSRFSRCFQNYLVVPLFVLMVVLSWVFALVFVIGTVGLADMCFDSPDSNFNALLRRQEDSFSPLIFRSIVFYVSGCKSDIVPVNLIEGLRRFVEASVSASNALRDVDFLISPVCNQAARAEAVDAANAIAALLCGLSAFLVELQDFLQCSNWYPLYETSMYGAMCSDAMTGFAWITSTEMTIVFSAVAMLTFRAGFYQLEEEDAAAKSFDDEYYVTNEGDGDSPDGSSPGGQETLKDWAGLPYDKKNAVVPGKVY